VFGENINKKTIQSYFDKIVIKDDCWGWNAAKINGYGVLGIIGIPGIYKNIGAHRLSYLIFKGKIKPGFSVLHKCDNPECSNPSHLFLGTQKDNMKDMQKKGRGTLKLTWDLVDNIRNSRESSKILADKLNLSRGTVAKIRSNSIWIEDNSKFLNRPCRNLKKSFMSKNLHFYKNYFFIRMKAHKELKRELNNKMHNHIKNSE